MTGSLTTVRRYLASGLFVSLALGTRLLLDPFLALDVPFLTFFVAITASAWYGGLGPGLSAVLLSAAAADYFFIPPLRSFAPQPGDFTALGLFIAEGTGLSLLTHQVMIRTEEARARRATIQRLVESITDAYAVLDRTWTYVEVNRQAETILGRPRHDLLGRNIWDVFPEVVGTPAWEALHRAMRTRTPVDFELHEPTAGRWYEHRVYPHDVGLTIMFTDVTDRKRTEADVQRLAAIVERTPDFVGIARMGGRVLYLNRAGRRMIGIPEDADVEQFSHADLCPPLVFDRMQREWLPIALQEGSASGEGALLTVQGQEIPVSLVLLVHRNAAGEPEYISTIARDIGERARAEEALRSGEARLRMAMSAGHMGAWDIDLTTGSVTWDAKQHELFGVPGDRVPQNMAEFYELVHPDDVPHVQRAAAAAELTGRFSEEFRIVTPGGDVRWIAGHGITITDQNGRSIRMIGVNYDITDRKESQTRLERFAVELERRVAERTEALRQSQEQLRALTTELTLAEQRERKRLATELHDFLAQMLVLGRLKLAQAKRLADAPPCLDLLRQAEEALTESLGYTRSLVHDLSPPVLHEFGLCAALKWLGERMQQHDLVVDVQIDTDEPRLSEHEAVLLFQSVRELLINASKYAGTGQARVRVAQTEGRLYVEVRDDGAGFRPEAIAAAPAATEYSSKFGLFSIRERMMALGGRFDVESAPGHGTTATLALPLGKPSVAEGPMNSVQSMQEQDTGRPPSVLSDHSPLTIEHSTFHQHTKRVRVLLVDDHAMVRQGLRSVLETYPDVEIMGEAWDGEKALAFVAKLRPTVVVMDVNMPRMNGIEATALIKARYPDVAVIGLSVNAGGENQDAMKGAGAAVLLTKEAAVEQLYAAIQQAVRGCVPT